MNLFDAFAKGTPLAITVPNGGTRVIAGLIKTPSGIAFADIGWMANDAGHPFHLVRGKLTGTGPWKIGKATIAVIEDGDDIVGDWNRWLAYKEKYPGQDDPRKAEVALAAFVVEMEGG